MRKIVFPYMNIKTSFIKFKEVIMEYRTANYTAFYVATPFNESNLGAHATPDFVYYNQLRAWKGMDNTFPFNDAHRKTYNVRDNSSWETLKSRLHERLDKSKNIILFLSENTKNSQALREEINYGINKKNLPVIVIYPDFKEKSDIVHDKTITTKVTKLWDKIPEFRDNMDKVPTLHIPIKKDLIRNALNDKDFEVQTMTNSGRYFFSVD